MTPRARSFLQDVIEVSNRPFFTYPENREDFYRSELAYIVRQIARKGKSARFSDEELEWLYREISQRLKDVQK